MTDPIGARHDQARQLPSNLFSQFTKVLVEGKQNALIAGSPRQHLRIAAAGRRCPDPDNVIPSFSQSSYRGAGNVLVGKKAHARPRSGTLSPSSTYRAHTLDTR